MKNKKVLKKNQKLNLIKKFLLKNKNFLYEKYKIKKISIFGSYARHQQKKNSDLDLLVVFDENATLFDMISASNFLEEKLKIKIDMVTEYSLNHKIKSYVLKEAIEI
ncbi:MAG: nucleotidyltransferase family protein [Candidatus Woesearchaeota archaeon]